MTDLIISRRQILGTSVAAAGTLALAACGGSPDAVDADVPLGSTSPSASSAGEVVATTGDFPTGGGAIVDSSVGTLVITAPADGQFRAFSAKCPHQGCPVAEVKENTITCNCHGSTFDAATGERLGGPAPKGLTPVAISVSGADIVLN